MYYFTCSSFAIRPSGHKSAIKLIDKLSQLDPTGSGPCHKADDERRSNTHITANLRAVRCRNLYENRRLVLRVDVVG